MANLNRRASFGAVIGGPWAAIEAGAAVQLRQDAAGGLPPAIRVAASLRLSGAALTIETAATVWSRLIVYQGEDVFGAGGAGQLGAAELTDATVQGTLLLVATVTPLTPFVGTIDTGYLEVGRDVFAILTAPRDAVGAPLGYASGQLSVTPAGLSVRPQNDNYSIPARLR